MNGQTNNEAILLEIKRIIHEIENESINDQTKKEAISLEKTDESNVYLLEEEAKDGDLYCFEVRFSENPQSKEVVVIDHVLSNYHIGEILYADYAKDHLIVSYDFGGPITVSLERDKMNPAFYRAVKLKMNFELWEYMKCKWSHKVAFTSYIWDKNPYGDEEYCIVWRKEGGFEYHCFRVYRERLFFKGETSEFRD